MAQHDYVITNGTGAAVRSDLNSALSAIVSQNSGATEPSPTYAYQWWADTTTGLLKIRNAANNAWVTVGTLASANLGLLSSGGTLTAALGSASTPGITFTGDTNTGIYSPGADQLAISTNGTGRLFVDSSGRVGVGTSSPAALLHLFSTFGTTLTTGLRIDGTGATTNNVAPISFYTQSSNWGTQHATNIACGNLSGTDGGGYLRFSTAPDGNTAPVERLRITGTGNVGVGTTSPSHRLNVVQTAGGVMANFSNGADADFNIGCTSGVTTIGPEFGVLALKSVNTERARIDSSGRLLVGTSTLGTQYGTPQVLVVGGSRPLTISNGFESGTYLEFNTGTANGNVEIKADARTGGYPPLLFTVGGSERMRIVSGGAVLIPAAYSQTSAVAANAIVGSDGNIFRSTSSAKYKTDIETLQDSYADAILDCRPVWYRSISEMDNPNHGYWGFIAEEVAEVDPRLVFWKTSESVVQEDGSRIDVELETPEAEGVQYDRFVPHLLNLIKRQKEQIEAMEARLSALEAA